MPHTLLDATRLWRSSQLSEERGKQSQYYLKQAVNLKKKNHRPKIASPVLKPVLPNRDLIPNLIAVLTYTKNVINQLVLNFPFSTNGNLPLGSSPHTRGSRVSLHDKTLAVPPRSKKKMSWTKNNPFCSLVNTSLALTFFNFVQTLREPLSLLDGMQLHSWITQ